MTNWAFASISYLFPNVPDDGGDGEVDVDPLDLSVQVDVEVLVGVEAAHLVDADGPDGSPDDHELVPAHPVVRRDELRVHKVNSDLEEGGE